MTVQRSSVLATRHPNTNVGDFGSPMPKLFQDLTGPVSRLAAASHRLRKAQLGAAFGQVLG